MLAITSLFGLLAVAIVTDIRSRKIPNLLVAAGILAGFSISAAGLNGEISFTDSLTGAVVGLLLFLPVFLVGKMGAGDVKLLSMCGAFLGAESTLVACLCALLVGGILALLWQKLVTQFAITDKRYPYAAAIAAGAVMAPYVQFT